MTTLKVLSGPGREVPASVFGKAGTILLESIRRDDENTVSYLFQDPSAVIQCRSSVMIPYCIDQIEKAATKGMYAAGFIGYEAGVAWSEENQVINTSGFPMLWFGLYDRAELFESPLHLPPSDHIHETIVYSLDISSLEYEDRVRNILQLIRDGETYQVNFTVRAKFNWKYGAWQLYLRLRRSQPVPYGAFLNCGNFSVASLSPELFLKKSGNELISRPMKGTAPRGKDPETDDRIGKWLQSDPKNLAENLMITDLMRNDLGRLSQNGKVEVFEPFRVESYSSLYQMTTGIRGAMRESIGLGELFEATFPPGSITGAPKLNTMKIISRLERSPRKVYTGAIGFIDPKKDLTLSVAIRTIISTASGRCEMGLGSGIVSDSIPADEFSETSLKGDFLNMAPDHRIDLFETILLQENGSLLWFDEHIDRLEDSAKQLDYPFDRRNGRSAVNYHLGRSAKGPAIVRLVLSRLGDLTVEILPLQPLNERSRKVIISRYQTDPADGLLCHKTTNRKRYDLELAKARGHGFTETLFINNRGLLTEGAFTNLFVLKPTVGGVSSWYTPALECGLLPGIWRRKFLESSGAKEVLLEVEELGRAERIIIGNSVRGPLEVDEVVDADGHTVFSSDS